MGRGSAGWRGTRLSTGLDVRKLCLALLEFCVAVLITLLHLTRFEYVVSFLGIELAQSSVRGSWAPKGSCEVWSSVVVVCQS